MTEHCKIERRIPALDGTIRTGDHDDKRMTALADLSSVDIETTLVADLSANLHSVFDQVCETTLPIYFGPLLGRLYLEGL